MYFNPFQKFAKGCAHGKQFQAERTGLNLAGLLAREEEKTTFNLEEQYEGISEGESQVSGLDPERSGSLTANTIRKISEEGEIYFACENAETFPIAPGELQRSFSPSKNKREQPVEPASSDVTRPYINALGSFYTMYDARRHEKEPKEG